MTDAEALTLNGELLIHHRSLARMPSCAPTIPGSPVRIRVKWIVNVGLAVVVAVTLAGCQQNIAGGMAILHEGGALKVAATGCGQAVDIVNLYDLGLDPARSSELTRLDRVAVPAPASDIDIPFDPSARVDGGVGAPLEPGHTYSVGAGSQDFSTRDLYFLESDLSKLKDGQMLVERGSQDRPQLLPISDLAATYC